MDALRRSAPRLLLLLLLVAVVAAALAALPISNSRGDCRPLPGSTRRLRALEAVLCCSFPASLRPGGSLRDLPPECKELRADTGSGSGGEAPPPPPPPPPLPPPLLLLPSSSWPCRCTGGVIDRGGAGVRALRAVAAAAEARKAAAAAVGVGGRKDRGACSRNSCARVGEEITTPPSRMPPGLVGPLPEPAPAPAPPPMPPTRLANREKMPRWLGGEVELWRWRLAA